MPDTSTEVAIATTTLTSSNNTISFSSIPSTYTDLRLVFTALSTNGTNSAYLRFNGSSTSLYSRTTIYGTGASASASSSQTQTEINLNLFHTLNTTKPEFYAIDIFSYNAAVNKNCLITGSSDLDGSGSVYVTSGLWRSTAAITSISLTTDAASFATGTTATLYGIL